MKLQALLLTALVAAASATECTTEQSAAISSQDNAAFGTACPALFGNGTSVLTPSASTTKDALKAIDGCKASACTTFLTNTTQATPDCEIEGVNVKGVYGTVLKLCTKFAAGDVSDADLETIFEDLIKYGGYELVESSGAGDEETVGSNATTTAPTSAPSKDTAATTAPTATKSSAVTFFTGTVAIATAAAVSVLTL